MWFSLYGASLGGWGNGGYVDVYSRVMSVVLVILGVDPILRSRCGIEWQKVCCLVSGK